MTEVIGRYELYEEIAFGGMGSVHFGRLVGPSGFRRTVAIKRLHRHLARDPEFVEMFVDEARLASRVRHPNVVATVDVIHEGDEVLQVMDYVHGETLAKLVRRASALGERAPTPVALAILSGVLRGLQAVHEAKDEQGALLGIIHCDVSPQNILVGVDGEARVLDFGLARATGRMHLTDSGKLNGKVEYMAPEQFTACTEPTRAVDLYAASVVLWEALVGQKMFATGQRAQVMSRIVQGEIRRPSEVVSGVPEVIEALVMRGLSVSPADRFATAQAMASELESCGRVASAIEVGDWVSRIARDELLALDRMAP